MAFANSRLVICKVSAARLNGSSPIALSGYFFSINVIFSMRCKHRIFYVISQILPLSKRIPNAVFSSHFVLFSANISVIE